LQWLKLATSKLARGWCLSRPIIKSDIEEKVNVRWARETLQNFGVPLNIYITAEASDIKFGVQLGFAKTHHKTTPRGKSGRGLVLTCNSMK